MDFPGGSMVENPPANAGNLAWIHGSRRCPGEGNCNPHHIVAWVPHGQRSLAAADYGIRKSDTTQRLNKLTVYSSANMTIYLFYSKNKSLKTSAVRNQANLCQRSVILPYKFLNTSIIEFVFYEIISKITKLVQHKAELSFISYVANFRKHFIWSVK